jgi:DNA-binding transcriptional LysR family regulator
MSAKRRLSFDLAELQVFLAVCETKTMVKAASQLGMTQPAVSHVILDIERRIGTELFDRSIRPIALTPAGSLLHERAAALVSDAQHIEVALRRSQGAQMPVLRVGLVHSLSRVLSVPLAAALTKSSVQVVLETGLSGHQTAALLARELDLLIGVDDQGSESDLSEVAGLERRALLEEPYVLVTSHGTGHADLAQLVQEQAFIRFPPHSASGRDVDRYLVRAGLKPARSLQFDSPFGVVESVAAGLGWAIATPLCLIEAGTPPRSLCLHALPKPTLKRSLIVASRARELGPIPRAATMVTTAQLREQCHRILRDSPPWILDAMRFGETSLESRRTPAIRAVPRQRVEDDFVAA